MASMSPPSEGAVPRGRAEGSAGADDGLRGALDRLSSSLERVQALLGELQASYVRECGNPGRGTSQEAEGEVGCGGAVESRSGVRIIYGGGPSAFARR